MSEAEKICKAIDDFADLMKKRMLEKAEDGWSGWEEAFDPKYNIKPRMLAKTYVVRDTVAIHMRAKELIDIANYAMMLNHSLSEAVAQNRPPTSGLKIMSKVSEAFIMDGK